VKERRDRDDELNGIAESEQCKPSPCLACVDAFLLHFLLTIRLDARRIKKTSNRLPELHGELFCAVSQELLHCKPLLATANLTNLCQGYDSQEGGREPGHGRPLEDIRLEVVSKKILMTDVAYR